MTTVGNITFGDGYVHPTPSALTGWEAVTLQGEKMTLEVLWNRLNELEKEVAKLKARGNIVVGGKTR